MAYRQIIFARLWLLFAEWNHHRSGLQCSDSIHRTDIALLTVVRCSDWFFFFSCFFCSFSFLPLAQWNYYGVDFTLLDMWSKASPALHLWQHCQLVSWPPVIHPPLRVQVKWRRASFARCAWRTCSRSTNCNNTTKRSTLGMTAMSRGRLKVSSSNVAALPFKIWTNLFLIAESGFHKRKASPTRRVT